MRIAEFDDPRLAAVYETVNTHDPDEQPRFVASLVDRLGVEPATIIDVGCGTGLITCVLAGRGHRVIGVDPSPAMIAVGRSASFGADVEWIVGGVDAIGTPNAHLAIMTSHVAQFFVRDAEWSRGLAALHDALRPGGLLGFESRNPGARAWEQWTPDRVTTVVDAVAGRIDWWAEVLDVRDDVVEYAIHHRFVATAEHLVSHASLRFRSLDQLTGSLAESGFDVERVDGDWRGRPADATSPEHVVVARRR